MVYTGHAAHSFYLFIYMEKSTETLLSNKGKRIMFVLFAFVMLYAISYFLNPYSFWWTNYFSQPRNNLIAEWVSTLVLCFIMAEANIFIHTKLNRFLPWNEKPVNRLLIETLLNILSVLALLLIEEYLICNFNKDLITANPSREELVGYRHYTVVSILIALMLSTINTGNYLIMNWKNSAIEAAEHKMKAAQHKQAAVEAELQALKLQIDPHFVFNSLSVLSELILDDQQLGYDYAENFSKVYRYLLVNSKKDLITLEEELKFLNAYIFLLKNRAGDGVSFEINIDKEYYNLQLPPLTLQLLIENALKHNKTLKENPLKISVLSNDHRELVVANSVIPLEKKPVSSGMGLSNVITRYRLLGDSSPYIKEDQHLFVVYIPLINL